MNLADRFTPTEKQRARFIEGWIEARRRELGTLFISEAFTEASDAALVESLYAYDHGTAAERAGAFMRAVRGYWERAAAQACAEQSDWSEG